MKIATLNNSALELQKYYNIKQNQQDFGLFYVRDLDKSNIEFGKFEFLDFGNWR